MHTSVVHFVVVVFGIINQYFGDYIVACDLHNMRYMYMPKSAVRIHVRRRQSSDWNWAVRFTLDRKRASNRLFLSAVRSWRSPALGTYTWYVYVIKKMYYRRYGLLPDFHPASIFLYLLLFPLCVLFSFIFLFFNRDSDVTLRRKVIDS